MYISLSVLSFCPFVHHNKLASAITLILFDSVWLGTIFFNLADQTM
jgi:hypothetical protein